MGQIFGKFYRFDDKLGNFSREDVEINVINVEDLEDCLVVFWVNGKEVIQQLDDMLSQEFLDGIGTSVLVLDKNQVVGMDVIDISESEKITIRGIDKERADRIARKEQRNKHREEVQKIINEGE